MARWPKLERELMGINEQIESDPDNLSLRKRQKELAKIVSFVRDDVQKRNVRDTIRTMQGKSSKEPGSAKIRRRRQSQRNRDASGGCR